MSIDPRSENAKRFMVDSNGLVVGVELEYQEIPSSMYQLIRAEVIDEKTSAGNTVANFYVADEKGFPVSENVVLAWPWPNIEKSQGTGNPDKKHMITNGFDPMKTKGPLALYPVDGNGNVIGDKIGGLGLPYNRHICFNLVWQKRSTNTIPPIDDGTGNTNNSTEVQVLNNIYTLLNKIATHFGVK